MKASWYWGLKPYLLIITEADKKASEQAIKLLVKIHAQDTK